MPLGTPTFVRAHGVLGLGALLPSQPGLDEAFIAAVAHEFPNVVSRQSPLAGLPTPGPRLILNSTSSQLALSPNQADFQVQFYGDYLSDVKRGLEYVGRKLATIRQGLEAIGQTPATIGVIATFNFSFKETDEQPAAHVLATHLRAEVDPDLVQDAIARIAIKVRDKYFVNLSVANYESRVWQRPILPGTPQAVSIKPWEGTVEDYGVELAVDINNSLEGRVRGLDPEVTEQGVAAVLALLERIARGAGPRFVETGDVPVDEWAEEQPA